MPERVRRERKEGWDGEEVETGINGKVEERDEA